MESIDTRNEKYAVVFNVNLVRATLNEASEFKSYLDDAIASTDKDIIVNLSDCQHLDSTFLGLLVSSYKKLKGKNRNLVLIEPVDQSSVFLTLNSIGKIFPIYHDVRTALTDIENKRILENEINNLDNEVEIETEPEVEAPVINEVMDEEVIELNEEAVVEPINLQETIQLQPNDTEHEDIMTDNYEEENIQEEIVEEQVEELEMQMDTMEDNSEEVLEEIEENPAELELVEEELQEELTLNQEIEYEDGDFRKGTVKWEFGFSS